MYMSCPGSMQTSRCLSQSEETWRVGMSVYNVQRPLQPLPVCHEREWHDGALTDSGAEDGVCLRGHAAGLPGTADREVLQDPAWPLQQHAVLQLGRRHRGAGEGDVWVRPYLTHRGTPDWMGFLQITIYNEKNINVYIYIYIGVLIFIYTYMEENNINSCQQYTCIHIYIHTCKHLHTCVCVDTNSS